MRPVLLCALFAAAAAHAGDAPRSTALTIVLEFQDPPAAPALAEMKREFETVFKDSGMKFQWRMRREAMGQSFADLVVMRFKGRCVLEPAEPWLYDERGPMAFTYSTGGVVQPYGEIACDRVARAARSAMSGADFAHTDQLLGRALGRVMAHEFVHMLAGSGTHGHEGLAKAALSGANLIAPGLRLSPADLDRIYTQP